MQKLDNKADDAKSDKASELNANSVADTESVSNFGQGGRSKNKPRRATCREVFCFRER